MDKMELVISLISKVIILLILFLVVILTIAYFVYRTRTIKSSFNKQKRYQEHLQDELKDWTLQYQVKKFTKEDMFSPRKMMNGEVELNGMQVKITDYTNGVPWLIKVR